MSKNYLISAPSRIGPPTGVSTGIGGRRWARLDAGLGGYSKPGRVVFGVGGGSDPLSGISDAWNKFLADGVSTAQVALGAVLVGAGLLILLSQTSAGAAAGRGAAGVTRRGLRAVPLVGAVV